LCIVRLCALTKALWFVTQINNAASRSSLFEEELRQIAPAVRPIQDPAVG